MATANNQVEDSAVVEQEIPQDKRKFIDVVKNDKGEEENVEYAVADFTDEQKLAYTNLESIVQNSQKLEVQYQLTKEQNDVLSKHYVSELKQLLSSGEDEKPEVVSDGEANEKSE